MGRIPLGRGADTARVICVDTAVLLAWCNNLVTVQRAEAAMHIAINSLLLPFC